ncbi:MAG: hypothetical protein GXP35_12195 [Actinobacteria bacterium]|nr:hypothetical protein [Actinomycetota bacterium]
MSAGQRFAAINEVRRLRHLPSVHTIADRNYEFGSRGAGPVVARVSALERARHGFRSIGREGDAAWCSFDLGIIVGTELSDAKHAEKLFVEARHTFARVHDWRGSGLAVAKLANLAVVRSDVPLARHYLESFTGDLAVLDAATAASLASCWADVHQAEGDWTESVSDLERAVALYEGAEIARENLGARVKLGYALLACRRLNEATKQADQAEHHVDLARPIDRARLPRLRADIAVADGNYIEAVAQLQTALTSQDLIPFDEMYVRLHYGELALRSGSHATAEVELRKAAALARDLQVPVAAARAAHALASTLKGVGDVKGAFVAATDCLDLAEQANDWRLVTRIVRHGDALSLATQVGDREATASLLAKLLALLTEIDDLNPVKQCALIAIEALTGAGDDLGARRLQARLRADSHS